VRAVTVRSEAVERPEDFDLAEAWDTVQSGFGSRTYANGVRVELLVEPGAVRFVSAALGRWANLEPVGAEGAPTVWVRYVALFPTPSIASAELARFGRHVEVLGPPEVRAELARVGEELVATYGRRVIHDDGERRN
jgi:hypothetical protein